MFCPTRPLDRLLFSLRNETKGKPPPIRPPKELEKLVVGLMSCEEVNGQTGDSANNGFTSLPVPCHGGISFIRNSFSKYTYVTMHEFPKTCTALFQLSKYAVDRVMRQVIHHHGCSQTGNRCWGVAWSPSTSFWYDRRFS